MSNKDFIPQTGMDVYGSDGEKVGTVDAVDQNHFIVRKGFFFPEDHYIPFSAVNTYDDNAVHLNVTKDGALEQQWGEQPLDNVEAPLAGTTGAAYGETQVEDPTYGETGLDNRTDTGVASGRTERPEGGALEVREEDLQASTREVDRGAVRVDKHVVEEQQSIDVPLTEEEVHVERRAVDRPADSSDFDDTTIEVPLRGEEAQVSKTARVVEEIDIDKTAHDRVETVSDTVRHEEVDIDSDDANTGRGRSRPDNEDDRGLMDKAKDAMDSDKDDGVR